MQRSPSASSFRQKNGTCSYVCPARLPLLTLARETRSPGPPKGTGGAERWGKGTGTSLAGEDLDRRLFLRSREEEKGRTRRRREAAVEGAGGVSRAS